MMAKKDSIDEELSLLDNKCKFNEDLATPQLLLFLKNTKQAEYHTPANIMPKILSSMTKCPGKPLQVSLKWLNFIHSGLQVAKCSSLAENLMDLLPKLDSLAARNKYEQYMILKLVRPYRQYLGKLGRIVIQKLRGPSPSRLQDTLGLLYCEFNLLLFACEEFTECSREFYGYFKRFFPCLNGYIGLLIRDMHRIFKKIKLSSERKTLQNVSDLEIEMIQSKIAAFGRLGQGKDVYGWLFAQTSGKSETVQSPKSEAEDLGETEQSDWGVAVSYFQS